MDSDSTWQLIALFVGLMMSAFFSASETALMSINKIRLRQKINDGNNTAALIGRMLESPDKLLSAILVGNNVVNIASSALATSIAINIFGSKGIGIATGIMTLMVLIFAEITPKSLAAGNAERIALLVARPINFFSIILTPIVFILTAITSALLRIVGQRASNDHHQHVTEQELKTMMDVSHEEGMLEEDEKKLLEKVFEFGDEQVRYVMIPRTEITAVDLDATFDEISMAFEQKRCSRLPVFEETLDSIIGILHIKDFFINASHKDEYNLQKLIRKPFYTIESKRIADLFEEMRSKKIQMAVVVDEYGGTAGIITMQDIVEVIFGDIDDEHDLDDLEIEKISQHEFLINGSVRLKDLNDALQIDLESDDFETIGGLLTGKVGKIPAKGDVIEFDGLICQIIEKTRTRISKIRISWPPVYDDTASEDGASGYEE